MNIGVESSSWEIPNKLACEQEEKDIVWETEATLNTDLTNHVNHLPEWYVLLFI